MHKNADLVRRGYAAFNSADLETLTRLFDENVRWTTPGQSPIAGTMANRDATFAQFGRYLEGTGGTFKADLRYVTADDEGRVVGIHHNTGARNGRRLDTECCITFRLENGRVVEAKEHFLDQANWDAFWTEGSR